MTAGSGTRIALWVAAAALLAHAGLSAGGVWSYGTLNYDDPQVLERVENQSVKELLTTTTFRAYKPVYFLSLKIDALFGSETAAVAHVVNWLLHALCAFLLVRLLLDCFGSRWLAGAAGLLFAVHPVHVENVAWIAERKDVLSLLFVLWAHLAWRKRRVGGPAAGWLPALLLLLGGLTKGTVWSYAGILFADEWLYRRGLAPAARRATHAGAVLGIALVALVAVGGVVLDALVAAATGAAGVEHGVSTLSLLAAMAAVHLRYLWNLVAPAGLALDYAVDPGGSWGSPLAWGGVLLAAAAVAGLVLGLRRRRALLAWATAFWIFGLAPVNNVWPRTAALMADRYLYLPSIGFYLVVAWALRRSGRARGGLLAGAAILLALLCEARTAAFSGSERVWSDTIERVPQSALAHIQRGIARREAGHAQHAYDDAAIALQLEPRPELRVRALLLQCDALAQLGRFDDLLLHANEAARAAQGLEDDELVREDPSHFRSLAEIWRGQALEARGQRHLALDAYRRAARLDDGNASAWFDLGTLLAEQQTEDSLAEAIDVLLYARSIDPERLDIALQLATVYGTVRDAGRALDVLDRAQRRHGNDPEILYTRAVVTLRVGNDWQKAREILRELRERDPDHPKGQRLEADIAVAVGRANLRQGRDEGDKERLRRAVDHFDEALRILPGHWEAELLAGDALAEQGRYREARRRYRAARRAAPGEPWIEGVMARTAALEAALVARLAETPAALDRAAGIMAGAVRLEVDRIDLGYAPLSEELAFLRELADVLDAKRAPEAEHAAALLAAAALLVTGDELTALADLQAVFGRLGSSEREPVLLDAALLLRAMLYGRQAEFELARRDYELLEKRRPGDVLPPLRQLQIDLRVAETRRKIAEGFPEEPKKLAEARRAVDAVAERIRAFADDHPDSSTAGLLAVQAEIGRREWIDALKRLNELELRFPRDPSVLRGFNLVYTAWYTSTRDRSLLTEADRVMRRAIAADRRDVRTLMDASQLARVAGDLQGALKYARQAREQERRPGGPASRMLGDLHIELGRKALEGGQAAAVREAIRAARRLDPSRAGSWILEGEMLLATPAPDRYRRAYEAARKAKELEPFHPDVGRLLARCHRSRAIEYQLALGAVRPPREGSPQWQAWSKLSAAEQAERLAEAKTDLRRKAIAELTAALVHDPNGEDAEDTRRRIEELEATDPASEYERRQQAQAAYDRGFARETAGELVDALHAYEEAVALHPRFVVAHYKLLKTAQALLVGLPVDQPGGRETADRYLELGFRSAHTLDALDTQRRFPPLWYYRGLLHVWIYESDTTDEAREVSRLAGIKDLEQFLVMMRARGIAAQDDAAMQDALAKLEKLRGR